MLETEFFVFNSFGENTYVIYNPQDAHAIIVDPGCLITDEKNELETFVRDHQLTVEAILLTHGHFDHVLGLKFCFDLYGAPVYMHPADKAVQAENEKNSRLFGLIFKDSQVPTQDICDGQVLDLIGRKWTVITTPGHTPGSVCYHCPEEGILLTGDTLFRGTIGRTDLPMGDYDREIVSIMDKIMGLDGATKILPGHGPDSTISDERTHNPFLEPFNEPEQDGLDWDADGIEIHG